MTTCGTKCFGASACVAKCIMGKEGYSADCSACFGDLGACTEKHCLSKCIGGASKACADCQDEYCVTPWVNCTGIPAGDLPPPPAPLAVVVAGAADWNVPLFLYSSTVNQDSALLATPPALPVAGAESYSLLFR